VVDFGFGMPLEIRLTLGDTVKMVGAGGGAALALFVSGGGPLLIGVAALCGVLGAGVAVKRSKTSTSVAGEPDPVAEVPTSAIAAAEPPALIFGSLPDRNHDFVPRSNEAVALKRALLNGGAVIAAVAGMGGVGKTALGVELAHALRAEGLFPGGVVFLDLQGFSATDQPLSAEAALGALIRELSGSEAKLPDELRDLQRAWRKAAAGRAMLLFLDNARDEDQVRPLLPGDARCRVLVTSRNRINLPGIAPIELGLMTEQEARSLALKLGNRWRTGRLSAAQAERLVALCGRHPLAIEVTAAALGKGLALEVEAQLDKIGEPGRDGLGMEEVKDRLKWSLDLLEPALWQKWQQLGVFEGDFAADAVAAVWAVEGAEEDLAELEQRSLMTLDQRGRLHLHDILRAVALEEIGAELREAGRGAACAVV
jgi:hypothetical protein